MCSVPYQQVTGFTFSFQATKYSVEVVQDNIELLLEALPLRARWESVASFQALGGISLLLQLVSMASLWNAYAGKYETKKDILIVL